MPADAKTVLLDYLQQAREAMVWKLDGVSEYDARRPMTPTGTNLLGLVKHLAQVELGYLGPTFGRPHGLVLVADDPDADPDADLWATPEESRAEIVALYQRAWEHGDETVAQLDLDAVGHVQWWPPERREVTLHQILVHLLAETARHAGHADVVRETLDGRAGRKPADPSFDDGHDWAAHVARVEAAARQAAGATGPR